MAWPPTTTWPPQNPAASLFGHQSPTSDYTQNQAQSKKVSSQGGGGSTGGTFGAPTKAPGAGGAGFAKLLDLANSAATTVQSAPSFLAQQQQQQQPQQQAVPDIMDAYMPQAFSKTLADYLSSAGDGSDLIKNQLAQLDVLRNQGKQQVDTGSDAIGQIYKALADNINGMADSAATRYQQAATGAADAQQNAQDAVTQNAKDTGANVKSTLAALGIGDTASNGKANQDAYTAQAIQSGAKNSAADAAALSKYADNSNDWLSSYGTAAGFEGANQQSNLQDQLMQYMSQLATSESGLRDQAASQAQQNAQAEYSADLTNWNQQQSAMQQADETDYQRGQDAQNFGLQQQQLDAQTAADAQPAQASWQNDPSGAASQYYAQSGLNNQQAAQINQAIYQGLATGPSDQTDQSSQYQRAYKQVMTLPPELQGYAMYVLSNTLGQTGLNK